MFKTLNPKPNPSTVCVELSRFVGSGSEASAPDRSFRTHRRFVFRAWQCTYRDSKETPIMFALVYLCKFCNAFRQHRTPVGNCVLDLGRTVLGLVLGVGLTGLCGFGLTGHRVANFGYSTLHPNKHTSSPTTNPSRQNPRTRETQTLENEKRSLKSPKLSKFMNPNP